MGLAPHPRTCLALALAGLLASLAGWRPAIVAISSMLVLGLPSPRYLGLRALVLAGSSLTVLLLLPFAPAAVIDLAVRGLGAALTLASLRLSWHEAVAELQSLGLPPTAVAFLALLARHVEVLTVDARATVAVLTVRGAFDRRSNAPRAVSVLVARMLTLAWLRADRVADAMALRGFAGRLPENAAWRPRWREAPRYSLAALLVVVGAWEIVR